MTSSLAQTLIREHWVTAICTSKAGYTEPDPPATTRTRKAEQLTIILKVNYSHEYNLQICRLLRTNLPFPTMPTDPTYIPFLLSLQ